MKNFILITRKGRIIVADMLDFNAVINGLEGMLHTCMDVISSMEKSSAEIDIIRGRSSAFPLSEELLEKAGELEKCKAACQGAKEILIQYATLLEKHIARIDASTQEVLYGPPPWKHELEF